MIQIFDFFLILKFNQTFYLQTIKKMLILILGELNLIQLHILLHEILEHKIK
jgi:hypothetical protein